MAADPPVLFILFFFLPSDTYVLSLPRDSCSYCFSLHMGQHNLSITPPFHSAILSSSSNPQHFLAQFLKFTLSHQTYSFSCQAYRLWHWEEKKSSMVIWSMTVPSARTVKGTFCLPRTALAMSPLTTKACSHFVGPLKNSFNCYGVDSDFRSETFSWLFQ